jgi:predicted Fe-Mo cluster-binding NifX family protein
VARRMLLVLPRTMDDARLAIPLFGDEVAPRFCYSAAFLLVDVASGQPVSRSVLPMGPAGGTERLSRLGAAGVNVLLAGGFNRRYLPLAAGLGIRVWPGLVGTADQLVEAFCRGTLQRCYLCGGRRGADGAGGMTRGARRAGQGAGRGGGRGRCGERRRQRKQSGE